MQPSEEIKSRLNIVDVIKDYVQLQAAGVNFRAKCPFHREKSPSFVVSPEKQIFHCFGCGEGGDLLSFVMKIENITFVEALRLLAPKAGVVLQKQNPEAASKRNRMLDMLELARRYYHQLFLKDAKAAYAREYIKKRGLSAETIEEWQIGYSPDAWTTLSDLLLKKGYKENEIFLAGLTAKSTKNNRFYDRFRGRIMFPINDASGNTVAFSARVSPEKEASDPMGKYINSPQTPLYDKSKILFGLDKAKTAIKNEDLAVLVEGQMDVVSAHQAGFKNVIASSGTALTTEQVALIKRFTENIALAFDADAAGANAADRGIKEAMAAEMNIRVIEVPEGKDPDDCIRENPEAWKKALAEAKPMMQYYFDQVFSGLDCSKIDNKRLAAKKLLPVIAKLENKIEKDHWLKELGGMIDVREALLRESISAVKPQTNQFAPKESEEKNPSQELSQSEKIGENLLALSLKFDMYIDYVIKNLELDYLSGERLRTFYKNLIIYYNKYIIGSNNETPQKINIEDFYRMLEKQEDSVSDKNIKRNRLVNLLDKLVIWSDEEFFDFSETQAKNEIINYIAQLKKIYLKKRMKEVERAIVETEKQADDTRIKKLMEEFKRLSEELKGM